MTRGISSRAQRRREQADQPLPPALRAELRARVAEAAQRREKILEEAKRHKKVAEQAASETYERIRRSAQEGFERERAAIAEEIEQRAEDARSV